MCVHVCVCVCVCVCACVCVSKLMAFPHLLLLAVLTKAQMINQGTDIDLITWPSIEAHSQLMWRHTYDPPALA